MVCCGLAVLLTTLAAGCADEGLGEGGGSAGGEKALEKEAERRTENSAEPWDINGDGYPELVVAAPGTRVSGQDNAGSVVAFAGSSDGPESNPMLRLDRASTQVPGSPKEYDGFGSIIASGDFDADGYADLAVCDSGQNLDTDMTIVFGDEQDRRRTFAVPVPGSFRQCGGVASGDVDGDGYDDLIVGGVHRLAWARGGPDASKPDSWTYRQIDKEISDGFTDFAVGDIDGDDQIDLTYQVGLVDFGPERRIRFGTGSGFGKAHSPGSTRAGDAYPWGGAADLGDVDGDGYDDLVVLADGEGVEIWYGDEQGMDHEQTPDLIPFEALGLPGEEQPSGFADKVALSDGPGPAELTISARYMTVGRFDKAGAIVRIPGSSKGPDPSQATVVHQGTDGVPGSVERSDFFGANPRYLDVDADDRQELIVGAPGENDRSGRAYVLGRNDVWWFRPQDAGIAAAEAGFGE